MALRDYKLCDVCGSKAFYDAELSYEYGEKLNGTWVLPTDTFKIAGKEQTDTSLHYLGDWAVICIDCSKEFKTVIVPIEKE